MTQTIRKTKAGARNPAASAYLRQRPGSFVSGAACGGGSAVMLAPDTDLP